MDESGHMPTMMNHALCQHHHPEVPLRIDADDAHQQISKQDNKNQRGDAPRQEEITREVAGGLKRSSQRC